MAMYPTSKDPVDGPELEGKMAQIYALLGDADRAVPILKRLLQIPYGLFRSLRRRCGLIRCGTKSQRSSLSGIGRRKDVEYTGTANGPRKNSKRGYPDRLGQLLVRFPTIMGVGVLSLFLLFSNFLPFLSSVCHPSHLRNLWCPPKI